MVNYIILMLLILIFMISMISVIAEPFTNRNSGIGSCFRAVRIRLREFSRTAFCVISIVLIIFGLVVHDTNFAGIFLAIFTMFAALFVLHPGDIIHLYNTRKKANRKKLLPRSVLASTDKNLAKEMPELIPLEPVEDTEN